MKPHWTDSWPSRCLGGLGPTLYFIPEDYGQIVTYSAGQLKNNLLMLAPLEWYEERFPRGKNVDWVQRGQRAREGIEAGRHVPARPAARPRLLARRREAADPPRRPVAASGRQEVHRTGDLHRGWPDLSATAPPRGAGSQDPAGEILEVGSVAVRETAVGECRLGRTVRRMDRPGAAVRAFVVAPAHLG